MFRHEASGRAPRPVMMRAQPTHDGQTRLAAPAEISHRPVARASKAAVPRMEAESVVSGAAVAVVAAMKAGEADKAAEAAGAVEVAVMGVAVVVGAKAEAAEEAEVAESEAA